jgi:catechol 2,3-dioxygenase-like lactoylglutathione lyase family enzyme
VSAFAGFDHIDCRVRSLAAVESFYDRLMPLLGLTEKRFAFVDENGDWHTRTSGELYNTVDYRESDVQDRATFFIGFTENPEHIPGNTRIAFRVPHASLIAWESQLRSLGACNVERSEDFDAYPALFFEDAAGTKLELVARKARAEN